MKFSAIFFGHKICLALPEKSIVPMTLQSQRAFKYKCKYSLTKPPCTVHSF